MKCTKSGTADRRMLMRIRVAIFLGGFVATVATLVFAGTSLGLIPSRIPYCSYEDGGYQTCATYNIAIFAIWKIGEALLWVSPVITAAATYFIARFTWLLKGVNDEQLRHNRLVERAYVWPGFGRNEPLPNGRRWFITLSNTGRTAGVVQTIHHAIISEDDFNAGNFIYDVFDGRENIIPPQPIQILSGLFRDIIEPRISCGYITYEDVFGNTQRQGWKHRLRLDGNSDSLPGCYSKSYKPWEDTTKHKTQK
jgi:hypothetical protein